MLYCATVRILIFVVVFVTVSNVVFMGGTDRPCSVHGYSAVVCDTLYIGIWCLSVLSTVIFFMEETGRHCSVAGLVLYFVTLCIMLLVVECVTASSVVFMEGTVRQCSVARLQCSVL